MPTKEEPSEEKNCKCWACQGIKHLKSLDRMLKKTCPMDSGEERMHKVFYLAGAMVYRTAPSCKKAEEVIQDAIRVAKKSFLKTSS